MARPPLVTQRANLPEKRPVTGWPGSTSRPAIASVAASRSSSSSVLEEVIIYRGTLSISISISDLCIYEILILVVGKPGRRKTVSIAHGSYERSFAGKGRMTASVAEFFGQQLYLRLFEQAEVVAADLAQIDSACGHAPPDRVRIVEAADRFLFHAKQSDL